MARGACSKALPRVDSLSDVDGPGGAGCTRSCAYGRTRCVARYRSSTSSSSAVCCVVGAVGAVGRCLAVVASTCRHGGCCGLDLCVPFPLQCGPTRALRSGPIAAAARLTSSPLVSSIKRLFAVDKTSTAF